MKHQSSLKECDLAVLAYIAQKPSIGYELTTEFPYQISKLYYILQKLQNAGLTKVISEDRHKAPQAIRHHITKKGKRCLHSDIDSYLQSLYQRSKQLLQSYKSHQQKLAQVSHIKHLGATGNLFREP